MLVQVPAIHVTVASPCIAPSLSHVTYEVMQPMRVRKRTKESTIAAAVGVQLCFGSISLHELCYLRFNMLQETQLS